jgi:periplasmic divalent cation tolerance protein
MALIYITCKDSKEAKKIALQLLKKKLIACGNFFPVTSLYHWKKKVVNEKEVLLLAKTKDKHYKRIVQEVKKLHSYKVPCILKLTAKANPLYEKWVDKEVK